MIAIGVGFLGVLIATRPGTSAFQPIVIVAIAGVACNAGYVSGDAKAGGRRFLAHDAALDAGRRPAAADARPPMGLAMAGVARMSGW